MARPDWSALSGMVDDLRKTMQSMDVTQQKMARVTGTAWSGDRLVKAVVGPRGHLVDLEIDPRVYRSPNSEALAASIVATVRAATEQALEKTQDLIDESVPADLRLARVGGVDMRELNLTHDADLMVEEGDDGELR